MKATQDLARRGTLYPAVILHGAREEQRRELALALARTLLCEESVEARPCGRCKHCRRIVWPGGKQDLFHPDFMVLERDLRTSTSVDAARALLQAAQVSPFESRGQVFVIGAAETLSNEAANALLKVLEEPPVRAPRHFFLLAPSRLDLLPTLRSRSLSVYLGPAEPLDATAAAESSRRASRECVRALAASRRADPPADRGGRAAGAPAPSTTRAPRARGRWRRKRCGWRRMESRPPRAGRCSISRKSLLTGSEWRLRGIPVDRILEGWWRDTLPFWRAPKRAEAFRAPFRRREGAHAGWLSFLHTWASEVPSARLPHAVGLAAKNLEPRSRA
jgi:hypothetical protein